MNNRIGEQFIKTFSKEKRSKKDKNGGKGTVPVKSAN